MGDIEDALTQHLKLAEQLRGQLRTLQETLSADGVPAAGEDTAGGTVDQSREQLLTIARSLKDTAHLKQLCELALSLKQKENSEPGGGAAQLRVVVPPPAPPAPPIEVTFNGLAKLGLSFECTQASDPPRIKSIASDGMAAKYPKLKQGLLLRTIADEPVKGLGFKGAMAKLKSAPRPLTLQFVESAYSFLMSKQNETAGGDEYDEEDEDEDVFGVMFAADGELGITFGQVREEGPIKLTKISPEAATAHRRLRIGIELTAVQGQVMRHRPVAEATALIKAAGRPLSLEFAERAVQDGVELESDEDIEEGTPEEGAGVGLSDSGGGRGRRGSIGQAIAIGKKGGTPPALGEYKLLVNCRCYQGPEMDSEPCEYSLDAEEIFEVVETAVVDDGVVRLKSSDGWINYLHGITGDPILVPTGEWQDNAAEVVTTGDTLHNEDNSLTMVIFEKEGPLGITFGSDSSNGAPPVKISRINQTGLGAMQPALRRGLVIVSIQGESVKGLSLKEVITQIKTARRPLTLEFEKDTSDMDMLSAIAALRQTKGSGQEQHRLAIGMVDEVNEG